MIEHPNYFLPEYLINNTPIAYPLCKNAEEAIEYLKIFSDPEFGFHNGFNYDTTDYEKLFYIEINFSDNVIIQELLQEIKIKIAEGYIRKHNYLKRIMPKNIKDIDLDWRPQEFLSIELPKAWHQYMYTSE